MGTMKLAVRPFSPAQVETVHSRAVLSASALLKTEPVGESFRFSAFLAGLILAISLALAAEVVVCATVDAAFSLVSKLYHEAILSGYHADDAMWSSDDEIAKASASSVRSSTEKRQTSQSTNQQIATHKITPGCLETPHACN
jgi:hypothetical protein